MNLRITKNLFKSICATLGLLAVLFIVYCIKCELGIDILPESHFLDSGIKYER